MIGMGEIGGGLEQVGKQGVMGELLAESKWHQSQITDIGSDPRDRIPVPGLWIAVAGSSLGSVPAVKHFLRRTRKFDHGGAKLSWCGGARERDR
jgi:hypothetical protein